ncbi:MAG TPA: amino acid adenylation domain-containing protein, partial [Methylococcales bacterium]
MLDIQSWSEIPSGIPLFDSIVFFDNYPIDNTLTGTNNSLKIGQVLPRGRTDYPVTVVAAPASELLLRFMYDGSCFDAGTINQIMEHLKTLLEGMAADPFQKLCELPLLTTAEQQQFRTWNNTAADYPDNLCLHQLFEAQVERTPDTIAVVFDDLHLSYTALNEKANQLADYLQSLGVKPEVLVGICLERSLEMVIGLLGIVKAGGAYLPLDPDYPTARLASILEDAKVGVVLTQSNFVKKLPKSITQVVCLDNDKEKLSHLRTDNPVSGVTPFNLAYVIYTSGSTGKPKGVMVPHQAITNHTFWMQENFPLDQSDKVLQKTPFSFDASVWEFYAPLIAGAQLIIAQPDCHQDPAYLVKVIMEQDITIFQVVPSLLRVILEQKGIEHCYSLKRIFCGGEALPFDLKEHCLATLDARLYNLYGPTEACIDSTFSTCQRGSYKSIGRPIANTRIYILDENLLSQPLGIPGELCIAGSGLARGYLNRPELTAEKFIEIELLGKTERI